MPGGLTGWAQVHGLNGDTSIVDRARFDNQYVEYWSPWLDVVILARTGGLQVARRQGGAGSEDTRDGAAGTVWSAPIPGGRTASSACARRR